MELIEELKLGLGCTLAGFVTLVAVLEAKGALTQAEAEQVIGELLGDLPPAPAAAVNATYKRALAFRG